MDCDAFPDIAKWVREVPHDAYKAQCSVCQKEFSISNIGMTALCSHQKSKKHELAMKDKNVYTQQKYFFLPQVSKDIVAPGDATTSSPAPMVLSVTNEEIGRLEKIAHIQK
jgi:hypothetical protein